MAGNQTRAQAEDGTWLRMEYDYANRLSVVKKDDGNYLQAYQYSPSGARLMNYDYVSGEFILYASLGGTTLSEYHEYTQNTLTWTKSYTYLGDGMLSTISNINGSESIEFNHPDRLGTRTITNQAAGTSYEQTTLPFGTALNAESTTSTNKRFTSYDRSARTGLDYAVNRSYDSKQGRFTQVDPIGMNASSLSSPQSLNLYSYCGNDPVNHTDPDGLFFGSLFKWIGKIFKVILIAVAVFVAVVAIAAASWGFAAPVVAKLALLSAALFAQALAPPKIGAIIGIITGMILMKPGIIVNLAGTAQGASKISKWLKLLAASSFVGAISNSFAQKKGKETPAEKQKRLIKSSYLSALWRLNNMPGCKEFIQEEFTKFDPASVLEYLYKNNKILYGGPDPEALGETSGTQGYGATILVYNGFFGKHNWIGKMNINNTRTLILLHELKHAIGSSHDTLPNGVYRNDRYFYNGIAKYCFGVN